MAKQTAYSMINVVATLDRRKVEGLGDGDDAITISQGSDVGTGLVGADGASIFSISADQSAMIKLKLLHTSPTHRLLLQKSKQQRTRGAAFPAFSFSIKDRVSGKGGTAEKCYIQVAPEDSFGTNATVQEWTLFTGDWNPEVTNV